MSVSGRQNNETESTRREDVQTATLETLRGLLAELRPGAIEPRAVGLESHLDRDLALDSLARAELLLRLNRQFGVALPERLIGEAETAQDFLTAILQARPSPAPQARPPEKAPETLETVEEPIGAQTLIEALTSHSRSHGARDHVLLWRADGPPDALSYRALYGEALAAAGGLVECGAAPGDRVALMLPTSREFFVAFFAILFAGGVPVPIYPPFRLAQIEDHLRRQAGILNNAGTVALIASLEIMTIGQLLLGLVPTLRSLATVENLRKAQPLRAPFPAGPETLALVQYTSGSTGDPKGVTLTHANLLANIRAMGAVLKASSSDRVASWLPLYHDMGLIGCWLGSLYYGAPVLVMSPLAFLSDPTRWLWAIDRHRATISAAPNFAFEFCLKSADPGRIEGLDLSSLRALLNGAEPVSPSTMTRFIEKFAAYGFRREMLAPVYGLAENSVGLAFPPLGRGPIVERIDRRALDREGIARLAGADDKNPLLLVACGQPLPHHEIRVIDASGFEAPERHEGRLQFRGPSATKGYFRNPEKTRALFDGDWLDTGDRGYIAGGDVFITGRVKDVIIRGGRNIYPQELEEAVGALDGARKGCVAAFQALDPQTGSERLIVIAETRSRDPAARERLRKAIVETAQALLDLPPDDVVLAPPHAIPKTSSGKIRRAAARALYEAGALEGARVDPRWQVARLALSGGLPLARRMFGRLAALAYGAYVWALLAVIAAVVWPAVAAAPRRAWRHAIFAAGARLFFRLAGLAIDVEGRAPAAQSIIATNHASYLDGAVVAAVCPGALSFVAKEELARQFFAGIFLRRLGAVFVRRTDPAGGVADARRALEAARGGARLVWFPEGTFSRMPGLLPFRLGAFATAVELRLPVVPMTISGTRSILRSGSWLPRRGNIRVRFSAPVLPQGEDFQAGVALRDAVRAEILAHCGEPDLAHERIDLTPR